MKLSYESRAKAIEQMQSQTVDLLIIGGGITGAGVALQAAASGLTTALIDMQDFAEGTSSRSTKLVHGGLRYLKHFDVEVVSDTVSERAVVQQIAPHIPKADPMLLPVYDEPGSTFSPFRLKVAMDLYDLLAGVNGTPMANKMLTKEQVLERAPELNPNHLVAGGVYLDYRNNDARLVIENIKRAAKDGALIASRVKAESLIFDDQGKVKGIVAKDLITNLSFEIEAKVVINTTGPWSDTIRQMDPQHQTAIMRPTIGVHLVVDETRLKVPQPTYFDSGLQDGRMIFVLPRENKTYFGTTDTDYDGDLAHPKVSQEDVDYLLSIVNHRYPNACLTLEDIESSWAGLRPLISGNAASDYNGGNSGKISDDSFNQLIETVKLYIEGNTNRETVENVVASLEGSVSEKNLDPSSISRGSSLERDPNGLLTLAGGKITDYRKMAEGALQEIVSILSNEYQLNYKLINSKTYPVSGGELNPANVEEELEAIAEQGVKRGMQREDARYLANLYGSNAPLLFASIKDYPHGSQLTLRDWVSLKYAIEEEMALTPVDFLLRRTNYLLFMRDKVDQLIEPVVAFMKDYYQWDDATTEHHYQELLDVLAENDLNDLKKLKSDAI